MSQNGARCRDCKQLKEHVASLLKLKAIEPTQGKPLRKDGVAIAADMTHNFNVTHPYSKRENPETVSNIAGISLQHTHPSPSHPTQHRTNIPHRQEIYATHPKPTQKTAQNKKPNHPTAQTWDEEPTSHPSPQRTKNEPRHTLKQALTKQLKQQKTPNNYSSK
jgi:hypothetical protein